ncbi:hypothetical protein V6N13_018257 [Hibiscus sabdariffa]
MNNVDLDGGGAKGNRKYSPVGAQDRAVLEMSSMDPDSSSDDSIRRVNVRTHASMDGRLHDNGGPRGPPSEHQLELFGFDSLVNILGLRSMTQEQISSPSCPRDNDVVSISKGDQASHVVPCSVHTSCSPSKWVQ